MNKKMIIAAAAIVVLLAVIGAFLLGASLVEKYWVQQCRSVYEQIRSTETMYYNVESETLYVTRGTNSSDVYSCWMDGDDFYSQYDGRRVDSSKVKLHGVGYEIDDKGRKPNSDIWPSGFWRNLDWEEFTENMSVSVATVDGGTEVSFSVDFGWNHSTVTCKTATYTFCFDENGGLSTIKYLLTTYHGREIDPRAVYCTENLLYTFRSFDRDEIRTTIEDAFSRLAPYL